MIGDGFTANSCAGACNCVGGIPTQATLGAEKSQLWGVWVDLDDAYHSVKVNLHSRLLQVFTNRNLSLHFDRFLTTSWFDYVGQERARGTTLLWWRTLYVRCRAVWTESSMQFRGCISLLQPWRPAVQAHLSCSLGIAMVLRISLNTQWTQDIELELAIPCNIAQSFNFQLVWTDGMRHKTMIFFAGSDRHVGFGPTIRMCSSLGQQKNEHRKQSTST